MSDSPVPQALSVPAVEPRPLSGLSTQDSFISSNDNLEPPYAPFIAPSIASTPRDSIIHSDTPRESVIPDNSSPLLTAAEKVERNEEGGSEKPARRPVWKRPVFALVALALIAVLVIVIVVPVYFTVIKPNQRNATGNSSGGSNGGGGGGSDSPGNGTTTQPPPSVIYGNDGSEVTMEDGTKFIYKNSFGGYWVSDPNNPFNDNAQPNSWTPPLNTSWTWGKDRVFGVNIGGWFVLEPFISPALYQKYPEAIDEWTLSELMAADTAGGGLKQLEDHYNTFITEQDIAEIAGAGLNWIRLPIPFWAIDKWDDEPFLAQTSWKYIVRFLGWARKYGLRVAFDLHAVPGSQNAFNHSGKMGQINFLRGTMGIANAQRVLNYIRIFTEFISQPEYKNVVAMFGIMNEPVMGILGKDQMTSFYLEAHNMMREITGYGEGNGPYISLHDGFTGIGSWAGFLPGSDRIVLDTHPYFAFTGTPNEEPIESRAADGLPGGIWPARACTTWGRNLNNSRSAFGVTVAGEFSLGFNDCGLFLRTTTPYTTNNGDCDKWNDHTTWEQSTRDGLMNFALASIDALGDSFFWTWKIGNSTAGKVESPLWSYKLGLENGWIPKDPRVSVGKCAALGVNEPFDGNYKPWQTGVTSSIAPSETRAYPWPPASLNNGDYAVDQLPMYTPTGTIATLPPPTITASGGRTLNGWVNSGDNAPAPTEIAGCRYPDAWDATAVPPPATGCSTGSSSQPTAV